MAPQRYVIEFQPVGCRAECGEDESLLDCARHGSVGINSVCGGAGTCGNCRVRILSGQTSDATGQEREFVSAREIEQGWRLACQAFPRSNIKLEIPPESLSTPQRTQVEGLAVTVRSEPAVDSYLVKIEQPSLDDLRGDADRLLETLNRQVTPPCQLIDFNVMRELSDRITRTQLGVPGSGTRQGSNRHRAISRRGVRLRGRPGHHQNRWLPGRPERRAYAGFSWHHQPAGQLRR